jgi:hypothetical protein
MVCASFVLGCFRMGARGTLDFIGAPKKIAFGNVNLVKHKERILYDTHIYFKFKDAPIRRVLKMDWFK